MTIAVGGTAGGGIDIGARLLARYLGKYLPGEPKVQVQLVPGAGGVRLIEQLYAVAPKDGSFIGAFSTGPIIEPLISLRKVKYKISDFTAVGALEKDVSVCVTWHRSAIRTLDDARAREVTSPEPAPPPRPISFRSRSMQCWARNSASSRAMSAPRKR